MAGTRLENAGRIFKVHKPLCEAPGVVEGLFLLMVRLIIVFRSILSIQIIKTMRGRPFNLAAVYSSYFFLP